MNDLEFALELVDRLYRDKTDRGWRLLVNHPLKVREIVRDMGGSPTSQIVALLHDTVEDNLLSDVTIYQMFGSEVYLAVSLLTRKEPHSYKEYIKNIVDSRNPIATQVKFADLIDNMDPGRTFEPIEEWESLQQRYKKAFKHICTEGNLTISTAFLDAYPVAKKLVHQLAY